MAVQHGDECAERAGTEPGLKALHRLRRQRDFRHEDDRAFSLLEGVGEGLQINLSFSAAGDAVEEEGA